jgi:nucleoside-diphosphate-sugar epimerase
MKSSLKKDPLSSRPRLRRIAVTGGSGKAGRFVVRELLKQGYEVVNLDRIPSPDTGAFFINTQLTNYGETVDALSGSDAVVHLAAIPAPGLRPSASTFNENITSTFNVFQSAQVHGMQRVVWASSETVLGLPFDNPVPDYAPVDEAHRPLPNSSYSLSKAAGETMATHFSRWTGIPFVGLRLSNVMQPEDYAMFSTWQDEPRLRKWNLWGYIDGRDSAQACHLALTADVSGAPVYIIAAADTVMKRPSAELMAEVFPGVSLKRKVRGRETLLAIRKAQKELGYKPAYSWQDCMGE